MVTNFRVLDSLCNSGIGTSTRLDLILVNFFGLTLNPKPSVVPVGPAPEAPTRTERAFACRLPPGKWKDSGHSLGPFKGVV